MSVRRRHRFLPFACILGLAGCGDQATAPAVADPVDMGDPVLGALAFEQECASCHATRDGFDVAAFGFTDTTIVRRAVAHVDTATAFDIVAYIRSLSVASMGEEVRLFQPGGEVLANDLQFAMRLFGEDAWPADLTSAQLREIDPLETPVAIPLPMWSIEEDNLDWMPDAPLPSGVTEYHGGAPAAALEGFYRRGSAQDLVDAVNVLRAAERVPDNPGAPCVMEPLDRMAPVTCFETRRWIASLGAQYMVRYGMDTPLNRTIHDAWWDVGNAARKSIQVGTPVPNVVDNWIQWMYVGWAFEPDRHSSFYLARGMIEKGLTRHAAFHTLRAQVERPPRSSQAFEDVRNAAFFSPGHWVFETVGFGYRHLLERLDSGWIPRGEGLERAIEHTERAYAVAARRLRDDGRIAELEALKDQVMDRLAPEG